MRKVLGSYFDHTDKNTCEQGNEDGSGKDLILRIILCVGNEKNTAISEQDKQPLSHADNSSKEKDSKKELSDNIAATTSSECVGSIGHVAIFYRCHHDPDKRKITIPGNST